MSNPQDYTVGWICAISTEYVAAQAFLDEKHESLEHLSPNDSNDYTLGKVGQHNVVIAVLPNGEYGTASAACVANDMLRSFSNIRLGLMVGIGGGAPSRKHDIRLGDIVVSTPRDGKAAVFQYDFGKTIQDQRFQTTGFLNQPPKVLQTAVSGLKAKYEIEGHQIGETINNVLEKKPRLQQKYKRPDPSNDRLYQSQVIHPPNSDLSNLISRPKRTKHEDDPTIHYGLIASANQLMKDALIRDKLAAEMDVLCFEMEAAGLMNHFPCLVIRSICDYSDSHKNKECQGYAAMAAAAYTKDLLSRIPPTWVEAESRISDLLSGVHQDIKAMKSKLDRNEDLEILSWLTPVDYGPQQSDYIRRRQPGTGQWLLDSVEYRVWLQTSKQTIFSPGIPGAGKTIIASVVVYVTNGMIFVTVHDICNKFHDDTSVGIAYLYCNFRRQEEQSAEYLVANLLKQLARGQTFPKAVKELYDKHKARLSRPLIGELSIALQSVASMYSTVFIIIDALDEYQEADGSRTKLLTEVFSLQSKTGSQLFITSRFIPEIEKNFKDCLLLEIRASYEDIWNYLDEHMLLLPDFVTNDVVLQTEIKNEIWSSIDGMFLLAQLHLYSLVGKRSPTALREALAGLREASNASHDGSSPLNDAYEKAINRILLQKGDLPRDALLILSWIVYAKRPITVPELQHALAVKIGTYALDEHNIPKVEHMVMACAPLVAVDKESNIIRLVHYTTQEYFKRQQKRWFSDAETDVARTCVTYLLFTNFDAGFCMRDEEFEARLQENPLYDYAARNWGHHARKALANLDQLILDFLQSEAKVSSCSQAMMSSRGFGGFSQRVPKKMTGVHLLAYFGLEEAMTALLKNEHDPNSKDTWGRTPLSWAARNGQEVVVKLLLEKGAELESKDNRGWTPLSWAARNGHKAVVKLLLEKGAELESKDNGGRTPLWWASWNGNEVVVKLLLEKGAELESKDISGRTPLSWAALNGHEVVVKLLLEKGANWSLKTLLVGRHCGRPHGTDTRRCRSC